MEEGIEFHNNNEGVALAPNGAVKRDNLCWCRMHKVFDTRDILTKNIGDITAYYIDIEAEINPMASKILGEEVGGLVYFRSLEMDLTPEMLKELLKNS